jgi:hypothetical protein
MKRIILAAALLVHASLAFAQPHLRVPQASPHAVAEETVGITDIRVDYHRPSVNGRRIIGGLVGYDVIWRTGANENTTITFSTPVSIEGQPVAAGTYSLFMIPARDQWTVVLNRFTGGWGTYSYDQSEDVVRVKVTPQNSDMQERMLFTFDDAKANSVTLNLRWEKTRVPVKIEADTVKLTTAAIRNQLRSELHWVPQAYTEAARWALNNNDVEGASTYIDRALMLTPDAQSLRVKARILEKKGDAAGAKTYRDRAAALVPDTTPINGIYQLIGAKKYDEAIAAANAQIAATPRSWRAWDALGTAYGEKGDAAKAKEAWDKAMSFAADQSERTEIQDSINALAAKP